MPATVKSGITIGLGLVTKYSGGRRALVDRTTWHTVAADRWRARATGSGRGWRARTARAVAPAMARHQLARAERTDARGKRLARMTADRVGISDFDLRRPASRQRWVQRFQQGHLGQVSPERKLRIIRAPRIPASLPLRGGVTKTVITMRKATNRTSQQLLGRTLVDRLNRHQGDEVNEHIARSPTARENPHLTLNPRIRSFTPAGRLVEGLRTMGSKVTGPATLAFGALDIADQVRHGVPVAHAAGRTGSGIAASALASAGAAALIPGPGWAVAGGIAAGAWVGHAWSESGADEKVGAATQKAVDDLGHGDVGGAVSGFGGAVAGGVADTAKEMGSEAGGVLGKLRDGAEAAGREMTVDAGPE